MKTLLKFLILSLLILSGSIGHTQVTFENLIPGSLNNYGSDVIQTKDSGYVVCGTNGWTNHQWPDYELSFTKTDKFGTVQWVGYYWQGLDNHGYSVRETMDGGLIMCGCSWIEGLAYYALIIRTDPNGDTLFTKRYPVAGTGAIARSVKQCNDQGFVITGMASDPHMPFVMKTDSNGFVLWEKTYQSENDYSGEEILVSPDSGFIFLSSIATLRELDSDGDIVWEQHYPFILGRGMEKTNDDGYIICGNDASSTEMSLLKVNHTGDSVWYRRYPFNADANSVALTQEGGYLIGGTIKNSPAPGSNQLFLLRLDHDGEPIWTRKFGGSDFDQGSSVKTTFDQGYIFAGTAKVPEPDSIVVMLIKGMDDSTITSNNHPDQLAKEMVTVFPNPTRGAVTIKFSIPQKDVKIELRDLSGVIIFGDVYPELNSFINIRLPYLRAGVFLLQIRTVDASYYEKILIQSPD